MLRRPWQIWLAFGLILILVLLGLGWLSLQVLDLDARERLAQARAEHEERINLALWRMESVAMPIVAAEAARPAFVFEPYQTLPGRSSGRVPSPLLRQPSEYVLLNFHLTANGQLISPQCPAPPDRSWAIANGSTPETLALCCPRVEQLEMDLDPGVLLSQLPAVYPVPRATASAPTWPDAGHRQEPLPPAALSRAYVENTLTPMPPDDSGATPTHRSSADFVNRTSKLNIFAQQSAVQQRQNLEPELQRLPVREGVSRALWIDDKLLLVRRVTSGTSEAIQGCWLDWDRLRAELLAELADLLPEARIRPAAIHDATAPGRSLASLPVELVVPPVGMPPSAATPTQIALGLAWGGFLAGCAALAYLLYAVTSLSERRAAFVSAVTHELRTPLTTFQLYTEMLAGGMLEDSHQQAEYIETLHSEAGRLGHLVDNVLAYARLERNPVRPSPPPVPVADLVAQMSPSFTARAARAGLKLDIDLPPETTQAQVQVEPTVIEQILLNLIDNACKYAAEGEVRTLELTAAVTPQRVELRLRDSGPGLTEQARRRLFRPFSKSDHDAARTAPGIGLGLALSRDLARAAGGDLRLEQSSNRGATFLLTLPRAG